MPRLDPVSVVRQPPLHLLCDENGSVLPTRAPERHRQVALAFLDVVRQQKLQEVRYLVQELLRLRELTHILCNFRVFACKRAELRNKVRVR